VLAYTSTRLTRGDDSAAFLGNVALTEARSKLEIEDRS
jgi:hypothetical protein